jgi:hypothetical protein
LGSFRAAEPYSSLSRLVPLVNPSVWSSPTVDGGGTKSAGPGALSVAASVVVSRIWDNSRSAMRFKRTRFSSEIDFGSLGVHPFAPASGELRGAIPGFRVQGGHGAQMFSHFDWMHGRQQTSWCWMQHPDQERFGVFKNVEHLLVGAKAAVDSLAIRSPMHFVLGKGGHSLPGTVTRSQCESRKSRTEIGWLPQ